MLIPFHAFGPAHIATLAAVPALGALLAYLQRRGHAPASAINRVLAAVLLVNCGAYYVSFAAAGEPLFPRHLPLEICDVTVFVAAAALLTRRSAIFDIFYYWALAGAGNALFTPNFTQASWFIWVQYFISHGLIVVSALFMVWTRQARPRPGSMLRVLLITNAYVVAVGAFNYVFGTNYIYLRRKPPAPTLLDILGPWPWYMVVCEALAVGLFALLYWPFRRQATRTPDSAVTQEPTQLIQ